MEEGLAMNLISLVFWTLDSSTIPRFVVECTAPRLMGVSDRT